MAVMTVLLKAALTGEVRVDEMAKRLAVYLVQHWEYRTAGRKGHLKEHTRAVW